MKKNTEARIIDNYERYVTEPLQFCYMATKIANKLYFYKKNQPFSSIAQVNRDLLH